MENFLGDFNIGTLVRNANAFNADKVFYYGRSKWDRRGAVGTHNYMSVERINMDEILELKRSHRFVAIEIAESSTLLYDYEWNFNEPTLLIFGEEGVGVTSEMMDLADDIVEIPQYGTVPSMNVGTTSGIVLYDYCKKLHRGA